MFEDIDRTMRQGAAEEGENKKKNGRSSRRSSGMEREIADFIEKRFGGKAEVVRGGIMFSPQPGSEEDVHKPIYDKLEGMMKSLVFMAEKMKIAPTCKDATGAELKNGDVLKCPGGELKTVLKVGWKFAILSHTNNQTKADGPWFEDEINNLNLILKK